MFNFSEADFRDFQGVTGEEIEIELTRDLRRVEIKQAASESMIFLPLLLMVIKSFISVYSYRYIKFM